MRCRATRANRRQWSRRAAGGDRWRRLGFSPGGRGRRLCTDRRRGAPRAATRGQDRGMPRPLPLPAGLSDRGFTAADAHALGVTWGRLRSEAETGRTAESRHSSAVRGGPGSGALCRGGPGDGARRVRAGARQRSLRACRRAVGGEARRTPAARGARPGLSGHRLVPRDRAATRRSGDKPAGTEVNGEIRDHRGQLVAHGDLVDRGYRMLASTTASSTEPTMRSSRATPRASTTSRTSAGGASASRSGTGAPSVTRSSSVCARLWSSAAGDSAPLAERAGGLAPGAGGARVRRRARSGTRCATCRCPRPGASGPPGGSAGSTPASTGGSRP